MANKSSSVLRIPERTEKAWKRAAKNVKLLTMETEVGVAIIFVCVVEYYL